MWSSAALRALARTYSQDKIGLIIGFVALIDGTVRSASINPNGSGVAKRASLGVTKLSAPWRNSRWALWLMACMACGFASAQSSSIHGLISLTEGQALTATQGAEEPITYVFEAVADETYLIEVDQQGLDFIVTVESPDGPTRSYNSPLYRDEREFLLIENAASGPHRVTLFSEELTNATGASSITVSLLNRDSLRTIDAWRFMSHGAEANRADDWEKATLAYREAARLWTEIGVIDLQAHALYAEAMIRYRWMLQWGLAIERCSGAAELYRQINDEQHRANALQLKANALIEKANEVEQTNTDDGVSPEKRVLFDQATETYRQAQVLHERHGNTYDIAQIKNNIGLMYYYMGEFDRARTSYKDAEVIFSGLGEVGAELYALTNQAVLDAELGYSRNAAAAFERVLEILPLDKNLQYRADILDNLGSSRRMFGDVDDALAAFSAALVVHQQINDVKGEARSLYGIGQTYYSFGELDLATEYLERALPKVQEANDGRSHEAVLRYLGNTAFLQGDHSKALGLHKSALNVATAPPDRVRLQILIARDLIALGRTSEARDLALGAIGGARELGVDVLLADALLQMGRADLARGAADSALDNFNTALRMYAVLGLEEEQANSLNGLALASKRIGNLSDAVAYSADSLDLLEGLRWRVAAPELRAFHSSIRRGYYDTHIQLLMEVSIGDTAAAESALMAALETSERSRARMTLELLTEASIELQRGLDPGLLDRRSGLYEELGARRYQQDQLLQEAGSGAETGAVLDEILEEMASIENELNLIETELRRENAQYASVIGSRSLSTMEIQAELHPESVLLQYALGDGASFVWIVTKDSIQAVQLADRSVIERTARSAFEALRTYKPDANRRAQLIDELAHLSQLVLGPVSDLAAEANVLVAADGALQYIPFGVLNLDAGSGLLLEKHEVTMVPSMSVLAAQKRQSEQDVTGGLAVFADPVFHASDPRMRPQAASSDYSAQPVALRMRSSFEPGLSLTRLPSTASEASSISELFAEDQRFIAEGFSANRDALLNMDLGQYQFVHFATHGLIDSRYPALSALALSHFDERGLPQNGLLRLSDIYGLDLNANLVVLSACNTALGREIRGEGLLGLAQGFMYAGAKRLLVSLWQVPDRATSELMTRFYAYMVNDLLDPGEALRRAQISIASERRWSDPYFWAAFTIIGDF